VLLPLLFRPVASIRACAFCHCGLLVEPWFVLMS
jgi:hypothetical protein